MSIDPLSARTGDRLQNYPNIPGIDSVPCLTSGQETTEVSNSGSLLLLVSEHLHRTTRDETGHSDSKSR